jgi:competence protein ComEA
MPETTPPPPAFSEPPAPPAMPSPPPVAQPLAAGFGGTGAAINLNTVTFEELRGQNLSVTQATRLLAHRERLGGFQTVDDLDQVAGFPQDLLGDLKSRSTV